MASDPLSAIEWLERRPAQIVTPLPKPERIDEPPVAESVTTPQVAVTPLGAPQRAAAGLLPASVTGLPASLWRSSDTETVKTLLSRLSVDDYPALLSLLYTLLLAEADAPHEAVSEAFLEARAAKLVKLGATDPAEALLERAGARHPKLFDLYFNLTLLTGDSSKSCALLRAEPHLSRDLAVRIYCEAQNSEWDKAALTLSTADAIGALSETDVALLEHFLDPELFEGTPLPTPPEAPSPLQFALFAAIGEPLPTASLPRAFAATDLGGDRGWKAQAEAAERLARIGAISENRLLGIYTSRIPSASGGIWDRIEAVQRLETALRSGDPVASLKECQRAWDQMSSAGLAIPFAALFAENLLRLPATGAQADLVTRIALLSPIYEQAAKRDTADAELKAAQAIAVGETPAANGAIGTAIARAFAQEATAPPALAALVREDRLGEAILRALKLAAAGAEGDQSALTNGLSFLRKVGLEDTARRHALQTLLRQGTAQ